MPQAYKFKCLTLIVFSIFLACTSSTYAGGDQHELRAPKLGVATQFQTGPSKRKLTFVNDLQLDSLRDGLRWAEIETRPGQYDFSNKSSVSVRSLADAGLLGSVTLHPQNPLYDGGVTVHSSRGIQGFARYVAAVASEFPHVRLEIANEFNSRSFVRGPVRDMDVDARGRLLGDYMAAIAAQGVPAERLIGGAAHSIPGHFLKRMFETGNPRTMGALALHPYSSEPEMIPGQIEVLRNALDLQAMAIEITEYGHGPTKDPALAADAFWKAYCKASLADVRRFVWYALSSRKDGYMSLLDRDNTVTPLGEAYIFAKKNIEGRPVTLLPDHRASLHGCQFSAYTAVLWGEPREVAVNRPDIVLRNAELTALPGATTQLDRARVLLVTVSPHSAALDLSQDISIGDTALLADTRDHWAFSTGPETIFERYLMDRDERISFKTCLGQDRASVPWVPYLCSETARNATLTERWFTLGGSAQRPLTLVHAIEITEKMALILESQFEIRPASTDGVVLRLLRNGEPLQDWQVKDIQRLTSEPFDVDAGDRLEIHIAPGPTTKGDAGRYRFGLYRLGESAASP